jgi:hypothetical protein
VSESQVGHVLSSLRVLVRGRKGKKSSTLARLLYNNFVFEHSALISPK